MRGFVFIDLESTKVLSFSRFEVLFTLGFTFLLLTSLCFFSTILIGVPIGISLKLLSFEECLVIDIFFCSLNVNDFS